MTDFSNALSSADLMTEYPELPPGVAATDKIVLLDGECVLCTGGARWLLRADRHGTFMLGTIQSPEGKAILASAAIPVTRH